MTDEFGEAQIPTTPDDTGDDDAVIMEDVSISDEMMVGDYPDETDASDDAGEPMDMATPPAQVQGTKSLLDRIFGLFGSGNVDLQDRLDELARMIQQYPDVAENYVFRGELYLQLNQDELAYEDFQKALEILPNRVKTDRWGIIAQVMQDRAFVGLKQAQHRLSL